MRVHPIDHHDIDLRYLSMESLATLVAMVTDFFNMAVTGSMLAKGNNDENLSGTKQERIRHGGA